jgi:hypothetical protein
MPPNPTDLAARLKRLLDALHLAATDTAGRVNYEAVRAHPAYAEYGQLVAELASYNPASLTSSSDQRAFWINLYNALVIDAVVTEGVKKSVQQGLGAIPLFALTRASFFQRAAYTVGGQRLSLNDIEHGLLRANKGFPILQRRRFSKGDSRLAWVVNPFDARIHFALNCASASCPPIAFYAPEKLDAQLELAASNFITAETSLEGQTVRTSMLFRWYGADFGASQAEIIAFIGRYLKTPLPTGPLRLEYRPYNWALNSA